ncbi:hypothetical protein PC116_g27614 [Phytophthora cactorum]|uniref:Uncharacterized protein n=1 Tax=Phytophthora cactorum TaxID=29920 RepID=A0A8T1JJG9_9STRA|nr:hypothetical protein PC114_g26019 [Phytophthora cactorum]KAG2884464.1 hypothetical protein PC117_g25822 [Phytophthora cactorum]KAG3034553.1 hypothetical protein PC119_g4881 [Phytophthora cactorum]KAG3125045.1 hypothetical protein C6341_g25941 [Phytophthora cactorum]KAG3137016.1 hypothetical protein PC128_g25813 [Phytophthora cactorum]
MNIAFIYPGAEGAAHDSIILAHSLYLLDVAEHHYVIAAGYALLPQVLTSYRGVRYHLKEWTESSCRPSTAKELYNLRHAKARNVAERVNGCLKRRFKILRVPIECEFIIVKAIIIACACLHSFIRQKNSADLAEDLCDEDPNETDEEIEDDT